MKPLVMFLIVGLCALTMTAQAQIPNPGFENWVNSHSPVGWYTDNIEGANWITITQTGGLESHSGTYAMRGDVIIAATVPYAPIAWTATFPDTQRHAALTGWYEFSPINGDALCATILVYGHDGELGNALFITESAVEFTQFSVPINYSDTGDPDSEAVSIEILRQDMGEVNVGSFFIVDDLAFGSGSSVPEEPAIQTIPTAFSLHQNYPNPFNPTTTISYDVSQAGPVELTVFDLLGKEVAKLASGFHLAGTYAVTWSATDLPSGTYLCVLKRQSLSQTRKIILVK